MLLIYGKLIADIKVLLDGIAYRIQTSVTVSVYGLSLSVVKNNSLRHNTVNLLEVLGEFAREEETPEGAEEEGEEQMDALPEIPPQVLSEMIQALPDGYRVVFNLFVFEKKSHKEIARMLGIKEDSSASQYHRARAALARKINEYRKRQDG